MNPELSGFWDEARLALGQFCGQDSGKRDKRKLRAREQLATECGLSSRTLKGFLNGYQKTLGHEALTVIFERIPALEARYKAATGRSSRPQAPPDEKAGATADHQLYVQMTLQFETSDDQPQSWTAHLPPGREAVLTLRIVGRRLA